MLKSVLQVRTMTLIEQSWWILMSSLACERGTELIHSSKFFLPLRNYMAKVAYPVDKPPAKWWHLRRRAAMFFSAAMGCGYCTSVWVAMPFAAWLSHRYATGAGLDLVMDLLIRLLVVHGLSNCIHVAYSRAQKGMIRAYDVVHTVKFEESAVDMSASEELAMPEATQPKSFDPETTGEFNPVK